MAKLDMKQFRKQIRSTLEKRNNPQPSPVSLRQQIDTIKSIKLPRV